MGENEANQLVEQMLPYERSLFLWLNDSHNVFFDSFMWIYSEKFTWIPLAVVALGVFTYKVKWQYAVLFVLCLILLGTLCDQLSAGLIKSYFERYRPTHHPDYENIVRTLNNYRGGRYGFISAHATNGFGIATFLSLVFRYKRFTIIMFTWAAISAYSRIYLGVHFISDVVGGMLLGILLGVLIYMLFIYCRKRILKQKDEELRTRFYPVWRAKVLYSMVIILVITIFIISSMNFMYGFSWLC